MIWGGAPAQGIVVETITSGAGVTVTADFGGLPVELLASQDVPRFEIEWLAALAADRGVRLEWLATANAVLTDQSLQLEAGGVLRRDIAAPAESIGGVTAVAGDALLPLELLTSQDMPRLGIEWLATQAGVQADPAEWLASGTTALTADEGLPIETAAVQRNDATAPIETAAGLRRDATPPIEIATGLRRDMAAPAEAAARQSRDAAAASESGTTQRLDLNLPAEWAGAIAITADKLLQLEFLAAPAVALTADGRSPIEWLAAADAGCSLPDEANGAAGNESGLALETKAGQRAEMGPGAETLGAAITDVGGAMPLEAAAAARAGQPAAGEATASQETRGAAPHVEATAGTGAAGANVQQTADFLATVTT